ncbi:hypothetical protein HD806DRAFT_548754 [Xylariaceae sp. AK1471]|nr:hypothetical protein HD806DRAFT_548754 [Xylariaceae sp. AK1471]
MTSDKKRQNAERPVSSRPEKRRRRSIRIGKKTAIPPGVEIIDISSRTPSPSPVASHRFHTPDTAISADASVGLPYDVCFGLLLMEVTCTHKSWDPAPEVAPVQITISDNILMLQYEGSGRHAGLLVSEALSRLTRECSVTLVATIGASKTQRSKSTSKPMLSIDCLQIRPLQVIVYGLLSEKTIVSDILDGGSLFLQRPEETGYDRRVRYFNPMYLLRPGEDMPKVVGSSTAESSQQTAGSINESYSQELERSLALKIFDEANEVNDTAPLNLKQSSRVVSKLKDHQLEALAMMIEREQGPMNNKTRFPSLWEKSLEGGRPVYRHVITGSIQHSPVPSLRGGILADEMGLGKTLSCLAFICYYIDELSLLPSPQLNSMPRPSLIVTPKSTLYGWQQQLERHIRPGGIRSFLYHGPKRQDIANELHEFDVVLTTYDTLRSDWKAQGPLYEFTWARIIVDEAHKIRNHSSDIFDATCQIRAHYRWCMTGTPIQNSIEDFGSLLAFIGVPPFVTRDQFRFWISSPIHSNLPRSLQRLRKLVRATCLRRTKAVPHLSAALKLTQKTERVETVDLAPEEREIYEFFKRRSFLLIQKNPDSESKTSLKRSGRMRRRKGVAATNSTSQNTSRKSAGNIIVLISVLRMICNHGEALLPKTVLEAWRNRDAGPISWSMLQTASAAERRCCVCNQEINRYEEKSEADVIELSCKEHVACEACIACTEDTIPACPKCSRVEVVSTSSTLHNNAVPAYAPSSKVLALLRNVLSALQTNIARGADPPIKSVIFSQWTGMLDMIYSALNPQLLSRGLSSVRIDGRSTLQHRRDALDKFNLDKSCVIMLATIGAVSEGIDLSIASETHIVEPHWNPMVEAQAVDRVHRIGQTRDVKITRYCAKESVEEYIRWVQARKLRLISQSLGSERGSGVKEEEEQLIKEERWEKLLRYLK